MPSYLSYLKKQKRSLPVEDIEAVAPSESVFSPEEDILDSNDALKIHTLLHSLSEPYKEVFMLRVFGELSFQQIGKIFDKTENWACVTYHRARAKIKEKMEDSV